MWSTLDKPAGVAHYAIGTCSLDCIIVATSEGRLCAVAFGASEQILAEWLALQFPKYQLVNGGSGADKLLKDVISHAENGTPLKSVRIHQPGTPFQKRVWDAIRSIPAGQTRTYAQLATSIGNPSATRAVARAAGANRIAVVIPCHRVVGSDGTLTGYRWDVKRKAKLLSLERSRQSRIAVD